tara:strand:- start:5480 stop:7177 length:1698 start_codon:yes stop_codon:yes gene_type:complete
MSNMIIENDANNKKLLLDKVALMYDSYSNDDYMKQKMENYICNQLPTILDNMKQTHDQRIIRLEELSNEQDSFIHSFLNDNQYFYIPATSNFFMYDGIHYQIYSEDEILHRVLSSISKDRQLMTWKHKTKINIMKRIKDNSLLSSIPESETIQGVLETLTNNMFASKEAAKYFLCVLGDNLLKKNTNLTQFISPLSKTFLKNLNNLSTMFLGLQISQTIKYKYHDHEYENCRIIKIQNAIHQENNWNTIVSNYALDIFCVAAYYSNRYNSSDGYIQNHCNCDDIKNSVLFIKNANPEELVDQFILEYIDETENDTPIGQIGSNSIQMRSPQITWKNMQYLWKLFLDQTEIPSIIFMNQLKTYLTTKMNKYYIEENDVFVGICSKSLPSIQLFLQFWNDKICFDDNESDLEIEELMVLFKKWCQMNNEQFTNMNDKQVLDLIHYYYPAIDIEKDKYLSGIRCLLWDKQLDIQVALENMKEHIRIKYDAPRLETRSQSPALYHNVSIYDAYLYYCKFTTSASNMNLNDLTTTQKHVVSKAYFEKYIYDNCIDYIIDSKFLTSGWYLL